jgi:hypothetical protein
MMGFLRRLLGVETAREMQLYVDARLEQAIACLEDNIEVRLHHSELPQNFRTSLTAAENSLRNIERRLEALERLPHASGHGSLGEAASFLVEQQDDAMLQRHLAGAAKARGMTIEKYLDELVERRARKAAGGA